MEKQILITIVEGKQGSSGDDHDVVAHLTSKDFDKKVFNQIPQTPTFVKFFAPWCGHSKNMLPDYEKVKSEYDGKKINGKNVSIKMYNSDTEKEKVKEYGVKGFPTLFVKENGVRKPFPHRTYDKISEFLNSI